ncbi:MAG: carbon dioxide concentrating mechanism protein CcmL [Planctomycetaceae bacterium]|nr:carbon dioxide concentrating mechanism protein CcmL [Planctomycetaceae bacterium]
MRIAQVIGKVTLCSQHPSLVGATWLLVVPLSREKATGELTKRGEPFAVFDELGANEGAFIAISDGAEAAAPFYPDTKPIDAYNAAILDSIEID